MADHDTEQFLKTQLFDFAHARVEKALRGVVGARGQALRDAVPLELELFEVLKNNGLFARRPVGETWRAVDTLFWRLLGCSRFLGNLFGSDG